MYEVTVGPPCQLSLVTNGLSRGYRRYPIFKMSLVHRWTHRLKVHLICNIRFICYCYVELLPNSLAHSIVRVRIARMGELCTISMEKEKGTRNERCAAKRLR